MEYPFTRAFVRFVVRHATYRYQRFPHDLTFYSGILNLFTVQFVVQEWESEQRATLCSLNICHGSQQLRSKHRHTRLEQLQKDLLLHYKRINFFVSEFENEKLFSLFNSSPFVFRQHTANIFDIVRNV